MIDTDKYEGHTPADEWCLVFREVDGRNKRQMLGLTVTAYHLGQMQACDFEDYCVAQANQDLARDAPLLLAEVKRLTKTLELIGKNMPYDSWLHTLIKEVIGYEKVIE